MFVNISMSLAALELLPFIQGISCSGGLCENPYVFSLLWRLCSGPGARSMLMIVVELVVLLLGSWLVPQELTLL